MIRVLAPLALLGLLSACDGGGDPVQQARVTLIAAGRRVNDAPVIPHDEHALGPTMPIDHRLG